MDVPGSYSLKWHAHSVHLNSSIAMLYRCSAFTDVVLATADGRYVSAHQFVLSACSQYLHNLFMAGSEGSKTNAKLVVVLPPQIRYTTLTILLQYIYKGEAIVNQEQLPSIMKAAELLQVRGLYRAKSFPDSKTDSQNILKEISSGSEDKNAPKPAKPYRKVLVSELGCNVDPNNIVNRSSDSPSSISTISRQPSPTVSPPVRKKQKSSITESVSEYKKKNDKSAVEDIMIEKMIVGEEIQVKDEPVDWVDQNSSENDAVVKEEIKSEDEDVEVEVTEEDGYVPLTCDVCHKTFTSPALWVRHIETQHPTTALASGKRSDVVEEGSKEFPPIQCEFCQKVFSDPAEWVRHIKIHIEKKTDQETQEESSDSSSSTPRNRVVCPVCSKVLQSSASMQIHIRTHTGERPFTCKQCGREFNVKSNYLRHMRTLHDQTGNQQAQPSSQ